MLQLEERIATLEQAQGDTDMDIATASRDLAVHEARLQRVEARVGIDGRPHCKGCGRILRAVNRKCSVCQRQN